MKLKPAGFLTKIVVLVLIIFLATALLNSRTQIQAATAERDSLSDQVKDQKIRNQLVSDAISNSSDPDTLEKVARDKGYVKKDEILIYDVAN